MPTFGLTILNDNHWKLENYEQTTTREAWRNYLLHNSDRIIVKGRIRKLKAKRIFADVYRIYKEPLKKGIKDE